MLRLNFEIQNKILERYKFLNLEGAASELQFLQQLNVVNDIEGKLSQLRIDRIRQTAAQNQQIQQLKTELEELGSRLTEASVNLRYQALRSPVDGVVFDLQPRGKGYVAQGTETVMKIVPYETLVADIEIPSNQIGFVKVGMQADLSIDSFPASDFGVLKGKVKSIGSDALAPVRSMVDLSIVTARIELSSQQFVLKNGKNLPLQVGMSLYLIKLRKVLLAAFAWNLPRKSRFLREL